MSIQKYVLTVDASTGVATKLELLGEGGELSEVDLNQLGTYSARPGPPTVIVNIFAAPGELRTESKEPWWPPCPKVPPVVVPHHAADMPKKG
jgi:hypothetical protein